MWLFTSIGFFSVVTHPDDPEMMLVRARVQDDIAALRDRFLPEANVLEHAGTDYRYRLITTREAWTDTAARLASGIDYPNFKNAVGDRQGAERAHVYSDVWETMHALQEAR